MFRNSHAPFSSLHLALRTFSQARCARWQLRVMGSGSNLSSQQIIAVSLSRKYKCLIVHHRVDLQPRTHSSPQGFMLQTVVKPKGQREEQRGLKLTGGDRHEGRQTCGQRGRSERRKPWWWEQKVQQWVMGGGWTQIRHLTPPPRHDATVCPKAWEDRRSHMRCHTQSASVNQTLETSQDTFSFRPYNVPSVFTRKHLRLQREKYTNLTWQLYQPVHGT